MSNIVYNGTYAISGTAACGGTVTISSAGTNITTSTHIRPKGAADYYWDEKPDPLDFLKNQLKQLEYRITEQKKSIDAIKTRFQEEIQYATSYEDSLRKKLQEYLSAINKLESNK